MPYKAKVYKVMIASPADVATERTVIRDVIHEWNSVHSDKEDITDEGYRVGDLLREQRLSVPGYSLPPSLPAVSTKN